MSSSLRLCWLMLDSPFSPASLASLPPSSALLPYQLLQVLQDNHLAHYWLCHSTLEFIGMSTSLSCILLDSRVSLVRGCLCVSARINWKASVFPCYVGWWISGCLLKAFLSWPGYIQEFYNMQRIRIFPNILHPFFLGYTTCSPPCRQLTLYGGADSPAFPGKM